jgi:adenine C2-methylase RlmN of 23S rRNA A2503 and tRNA A37
VDTLYSKIDDSVNLVRDHSKGGVVESRYVRRTLDKAAFYLSTATGCNQLCKFCHLTATKQYTTNYLTEKEILEQIRLISLYYRTQVPAEKIHYNFMARGEPLLNKNITNDYGNFAELMIKESPIPEKTEINISTILPKNIDVNCKALINKNYHLFYSLYSLNKDFRDKWMPNAMNPNKALDLLAYSYMYTNNKITIHYALIKGINDSQQDAEEIGYALLDKFDFDHVRVSLIEYNPYDVTLGEPSDNTRNYYEVLSDMGIELKLIRRVGHDVKASCGMFING